MILTINITVPAETPVPIDHRHEDFRKGALFLALIVHEFLDLHLQVIQLPAKVQHREEEVTVISGNRGVDVDTADYLTHEQ